MNIQLFGARANDHSDTTPAVREALKAITGSNTRRLAFPKGRYDFWPDRTAEQYEFVSNNDASLKSIAFPLNGFSNLEIDGDGSEFVFHSYIVPFVLKNCSNVSLRNFTIDWERTFHSEAKILDSRPGSVDLEISAEFPYRIDHNRLLFVGEKGEPFSIGNILEFDSKLRETAFKVPDNWEARYHTAHEIEPGIVHYAASFAQLPQPGNIVALQSVKRLCPGIVISHSTEIGVSDVTLYHAGGMGLIAQCSADLNIERLLVIPNPAKDRMISVTADATHFVNCRGLISMTDCVFENQLDDPTNVHGIYARISQVISDTEIEVELVHDQQQGIDITHPHDTLEFVENTTLMTYHHADVSSVERLNQRFSRIALTETLSDTVKSGDVVASCTWTPNVHIRGCITRSNRARGFLLSTPGKVMIEENEFHNPGAAILIAGDANYWFESGAVRDVTIRNNHFDNCFFGGWGRATIDINPEVAHADRGRSLYHRNIMIDHNTFTAFDPALLKAHCVDGLTVTNNIIYPSDSYPAPSAPAAPFETGDCKNVTIEDNTFILEAMSMRGDEQAAALLTHQ